MTCHGIRTLQSCYVLTVYFSLQMRVLNHAYNMNRPAKCVQISRTTLGTPGKLLVDLTFHVGDAIISTQLRSHERRNNARGGNYVAELYSKDAIASRRVKMAKALVRSMYLSHPLSVCRPLLSLHEKRINHLEKRRPTDGRRAAFLPDRKSCFIKSATNVDAKSCKYQRRGIHHNDAENIQQSSNLMAFCLHCAIEISAKNATAASAPSRMWLLGTCLS